MVEKFHKSNIFRSNLEAWKHMNFNLCVTYKFLYCIHGRKSHGLNPSTFLCSYMPLNLSLHSSGLPVHMHVGSDNHITNYNNSN
jgi:hypothetical protein